MPSIIIITIVIIASPWFVFGFVPFIYPIFVVVCSCVVLSSDRRGLD